MNKTFLATVGILALTIGAADARQPKPKRVAPFEQPFAVAMLVTDPEVVVAAHGPFELIARCFPSPVSGLPRSRLVIRSAVNGWALTQAIDPTRTNLFDLPAGEEPIGGVTTSAPTIEPGASGTALAPTGEILAVDGETSIRAMHILPGADCVWAGVATMLKVPAP